MAAIAALVLRLFAADSFGAENVAPTKAELEEMYNAAFRAFDSGKFAEALKQLDGIDARQPDLAASKNLRGVTRCARATTIRRKQHYRTLSESIPSSGTRASIWRKSRFLKDWPEARNRFEQLLSSGNPSGERGFAADFNIKFCSRTSSRGKTTWWILFRPNWSFRLIPPAVDYVKAAVALKQKESKRSERLDRCRGKELFTAIKQAFRRITFTKLDG